MAITTWKAILKEQKQNHSLPGSLYVNNDRWVEAWYGLHPLFPGQRTICRARRILAERLGRPLIRSEHAHHKNNNKLDDRSSNITLLTISVHNSLTHTGKKVTAETRQKISHARKGIEFSVEHRQKIGLAHKGNKYWKNRKHTFESRQKMSLAKKGKKLSLEHRLKISLGHIKYISE